MLNGLVGKSFLWFIKRQTFYLSSSVLFILPNLKDKMFLRYYLLLCHKKKDLLQASQVTHWSRYKSEKNLLQLSYQEHRSQLSHCKRGKWSVLSLHPLGVG